MDEDYVDPNECDHPNDRVEWTSDYIYVESQEEPLYEQRFMLCRVCGTILGEEVKQ